MRVSSKCSAQPAVIGVDIGKDVFHLVAFTADGEVAFRKKIKRHKGRVRPGAPVGKADFCALAATWAESRRDGRPVGARFRRFDLTEPVRRLAG